MKKAVLSLIILLILSVSGRGNVAPPQAFISELYFNSQGNWTIELGFYTFMTVFDSLKIETTGGSSLIAGYTMLPGCWPLYPFDSLALITDANLHSPLPINPNGDFVKLYSYTSYGSFVEVGIDSVIFGSLPGSYIDYLLPGQSIPYVVSVISQGYVTGFCVDDSPTLGSCNDTVGTTGILSGMVYDTNGTVFTGGTLLIGGVHNLTATIGNNGFYSSPVFARAYPMDRVTIISGPGDYRVYTIVPVSPWVEPSSSVTCDIHTLSLVTSANEIESPAIRIIAYPNPFASDISFFFKNTVKSIRAEHIEVFDQSGQMVFGSPVQPETERITWKPAKELQSGIFYYRVKGNGRTLSTGKIIKIPVQ